MSFRYQLAWRTPANYKPPSPDHILHREARVPSFSTICAYPSTTQLHPRSRVTKTPLDWNARSDTNSSQKQNDRRIGTQAKQQREACASRGSSRWKGGLRNRPIVVVVLPHSMPCVKKRSGHVWSYKSRSGYSIATSPQPFRHHSSYISNTSNSHTDRSLQSSLVLRFVNNDFQENKEPTIGGTLTPIHHLTRYVKERLNADILFAKLLSSHRRSHSQTESSSSRYGIPRAKNDSPPSHPCTTAMRKLLSSSMT